jgi:hypothetical protein
MRLSLKKRLILTGVWLLFMLLAPVFLWRNPHPPGTLNYRLAWDWGTAEALEQGWRVENDLGYEIVVQRGYLVSYSAELVACPHFHFWWETAFAPMLAYAGHGANHDESQMATPIIEALDNPQNSEWGSVTIHEPSYCQAHYLIARGSSAVPDMYGLSLWIEGTYERDGEALPFRLETSLANGKMFEIQMGSSGTVMINRRLDALFTGVDFGSMDESEMGQAALWTLIDSVVVTSDEQNN